MAEHLLLKWGTLKGWGDLRENPAAAEAFRRYIADPVSMGAMTQRDTVAQKHALCDLIDAVDGEIIDDWSGEAMSKDEAKSYVLEYR